ncbi:hypothetical protein Hanom_Chr09g00815051 [Helianthus anomalus]
MTVGGVGEECARKGEANLNKGFHGGEWKGVKFGWFCSGGRKLQEAMVVMVVVAVNEEEIRLE